MRRILQAALQAVPDAEWHIGLRDGRQFDETLHYFSVFIGESKRYKPKLINFDGVSGLFLTDSNGAVSLPTKIFMNGEGYFRFESMSFKGAEVFESVLEKSKIEIVNEKDMEDLELIREVALEFKKSNNVKLPVIIYHNLLMEHLSLNFMTAARTSIGDFFITSSGEYAKVIDIIY